MERVAQLWDGAKVVWVGADRPDDGLEAGDRVVVSDAGGHDAPAVFIGLAALFGRGRRRWLVIETPDGRRVRVRRGDVEVAAPDHPLVAESDASVASWWLDQLLPWGEDLPVGAFVPASLPHVVCVLHPWSGDDPEVTWTDVADEVGFTSWTELVDEACDEGRDREDRLVPPDRFQPPSVGRMPRPTAQRLVDALATETSTPDDVVVAVWTGWGDVPVQQFPGAVEIPTPLRGHFLLSGPITGVLDSVAAVDFLDEVEAGIWWPQDRAWLVCTEVDFAWTFVAGDQETITRLDHHPELETVRVGHATPADRPDS